MKYLLVTTLVFLSALAVTPGIAQSNDAAAERARLANQRIQVEAERRARDEEERLQQATKQATAQEEAAAQANLSSNKVSSGDADLTRTLEQLRTLGELRDAGYVTSEEFDRIKQKILASAL